MLDISMPKLSGLEVLIKIREKKLSTKVLILSMYPEKEYAVRALKNGADGYITKESAAEELHEAIDTVLKGEKYVSKNLQKILLDKYTDGTPSVPHENLSDREFNVFLLIAKGKSPQEIASQLSISHKTVSTYKSRLMNKLGLNSVTELTRYAIQHKLIE
ncbi:MAG: response regulator transcription factor [Melioribacteraceae bacterium]|nr:response regulator transcription factor [Melioribacteraceae bacterium]